MQLNNSPTNKYRIVVDKPTKELLDDLNDLNNNNNNNNDDTQQQQQQQQQQQATTDTAQQGNASSPLQRTTSVLHQSSDNSMLDRLTAAHLLVQKRRYRERMYRDLCLFVLFYSLFIAITFMQRDVTTAFYTEDALRNAFIDEEFLPRDAFVYKNFESIGQVEEFWQWTLGPFLDAISQQNNEEQGFILRFNRLIGSPRVRQFRVRDDACEIVRELAPFYDGTGCYTFYEESKKSTAPYGPTLNNSNAASFGINNCAPDNALPGFCHRLTTSPYLYGRVADWYDSGGYFVDLSYNADQARLQLTALRDAGWIDLQTSAVVFSVNVFNPNVAMFVNMVFVVEFTPGGGFINSHNFRSFRSDLYYSTTDMIRFALEIIWVVMLVLWLLYTAYQMYEVKRTHGSVLVWLIRPWWNFIDLVNKIVFVVTTVWYVLFIVRLERFKTSIIDLNQDTDFVAVEELGYQWILLFNIVAVNIIISTFTVFKFLNVNPRMSMMWKTLEKALPDLGAFLIFFGIIFLTFVSTAYMMFGTKLTNFRTFTKAIFACFNMLLGSFEYSEMEENGNRFFAPLFFTLFMIFVTFILVNMFLAIVQDAYVVVQTKYQNRPTLAIALRRWVAAQVDRARSCVGKTMTSEAYESAVVEISMPRVKRYLQQLNVQDGTELSMEEIMRILPNAPETHVEYLFNLLGDPDALRAVHEAEDDEDDEGANDGAPGADAADANARTGPVQVSDVLRSLLMLEDRLAAMETEIVNAQARRLQSSAAAGAPVNRGALQRLKSVKNVRGLGRTVNNSSATSTTNYDLPEDDPRAQFGALPPLPSVAASSSSLAHQMANFGASRSPRANLKQSTAFAHIDDD